VSADAVGRALDRLTGAGSGDGEPAPASAAGAPTGDAARVGEIEAAVESLSSAFERDADALSADRLGARHAPLAQALVTAAEDASAASRPDLVFRIADLLGAMGPLEPSLEARLFESLAPWMEAAAGEEVMPAAGDSGGRMMYTVRRGDTLWSIAARVTGDPRKWREIYERHNRAAELGIGTPIANPHRLRPGQQITVPLSSTGANAIDYHVARGESLSGIARRIYGSAAMWRDIYRDNAEQIRNPDLIRPGQVLVLQPARRP
jgi:nucleoid-associated protein YgaU